MILGFIFFCFFGIQFFQKIKYIRLSMYSHKMSENVDVPDDADDEIITVNIRKSDYIKILKKKEFDDYIKYSTEYAYRHYNYVIDPEILAIKKKELADVEEMMTSVDKNDLDSVKKIFERDSIKIPFAIVTSSNYYRGTGYGYELKYERALTKAVKLGHFEIIKFLFDNNVYADMNLRSYSESRLPNKEITEYINKKYEENEKCWINNEQIHFKSIPKVDKRSPAHDLVKKNIENDIIRMFQAVNRCDFEEVRNIFERQKEEPLRIMGYKESHYDQTFKDSVEFAVKLIIRNENLEEKQKLFYILKYFIEHKVDTEYLYLLNIACPNADKDKFKLQEDGYDFDNSKFEYTELERYLIHAGIRYYYDYFKRETEMSNLDEEIKKFYLTYTVEEINGFIDKMMKAVINSDVKIIKEIFDLGPKIRKQQMFTKFNYSWLYKECLIKAVELDNYDVLEIFMNNGVDYTGIPITGNLEKLYRQHRY
jgi:hypothetical protein